MKNKASRESEIEYQKDLCLTILDFFLTQKQSLPSHWITLMKDNVNAAFEIKHLKSLKIGANKLQKMAMESLNAEQINQLDSILLNKFGITIQPFDNSQIEKIIKTGKIKTADEYELMLEYFEQILQISRKEEYIEMISSLLNDYQLRTGKI